MGDLQIPEGFLEEVELYWNNQRISLPLLAWLFRQLTWVLAPLQTLRWVPRHRNCCLGLTGLRVGRFS